MAQTNKKKTGNRHIFTTIAYFTNSFNILALMVWIDDIEFKVCATNFFFVMKDIEGMRVAKNNDYMMLNDFLI